MPAASAPATVRPARADDAPAIHALHALTVGDAFAGLLGSWAPPEDERTERERSWTGPIGDPLPRHALLVAERGGLVVGFTATGPTRDPAEDRETVAELRTVMVDARLRGTGAGGALVRAGEEAMAEARFAVAELWVVPQNAAAIRCYERAGWAPDGAERLLHVGGRDVPAIRYRKALNAPAPPAGAA